jgi:hypothetical protein
LKWNCIYEFSEVDDMVGYINELIIHLSDIFAPNSHNQH